jgi:multicomponent Na+:H+ antiporter subunit A
MRRSLIAEVSVTLLFHSILVLSLYFLFAGHNQPGGGFVGGLVAGSAVALRYVVGGIDDVRSLTRVPPWGVLGTGLCLSSITATVPLLLGRSLLEHDDVGGTLPLLGTVKATTALPFDVGVYLVVVGVVLMAFEAFGDDEDSDDEHSGDEHSDEHGAGRT